LVQADQAPNAVVSQWIGHGLSLHASVSSVCGHASPPYCVWVACVRERDLEPPSHDLVQLDQSLSPAAQSVMSQSMGQRARAHDPTIMVAGQAWPPLDGCVASRSRYR
jgi:hypothetical protein